MSSPIAATIEHRSWGEWPSIRLASEAVEVEVVGELGARVVSLRDRRRDREWLLQGRHPRELEGSDWAREGAVFGGRESFGWDECLPTTTPCPDPLAAEGPALRDHGDQWGRGSYLALDHAAGAIEHRWSAPRWPYRLSRRLSFADAETLLAEYLVTSHADVPLPLSWAQHPVLRVEPGSRIELPGAGRVRRTWQGGIELPAEGPWPLATAADGQEHDLAVVSAGEGWAAVLYADTPGAAVETPDGARLELTWDRVFAPALRVWLAYGGWPSPHAPVEQIALEPCTSEHDDLASAIAAGEARTLPPGGELRWWVRMRLS